MHHAFNHDSFVCRIDNDRTTVNCVADPHLNSQLHFSVKFARWEKDERQIRYLSVSLWEFHSHVKTCSINNFIVIEVSEDGKKIRCSICFAASEQNGSKWIKKESLSTHLSSDIHKISVDSQLMRESAQNAGEQSVQEECAMEESMDFAILSSVTQPVVTTKAHASHSNIEEQEMWDNYKTSNVMFDAGIDPALAAVEERKRLVLEAINLDIWQGTDFLPEEDPNNGEQLLEDLEQDDIMTELLRNARRFLFSIFKFLSIFGLFRFGCT